MDEIETLIILTLNAIIAGAACIPFGLACSTQKNLRPYFFAYLVLAIGLFLLIFQFVNFTIRLLANIFFALSAIILFIAGSLEYYKTFIKSNNQNIGIRDKLIATLILSPIIIMIEFFIIIILSIIVIMLFRIYMRTHSATKLFLLMTAISAIICEIALCLRSYDIEGTYFFSSIITTFFVTLMLSTGFVALLEQKIIDTLHEKNYLKDQYSHDLGNILHTISMAYGLFNLEHSSEIKTDDLDNLIKGKISEASKLIKFIRNI